MKRRSGFTLVELMVVVVIIGILMGLILPAVQGARNTAQRAACGNNLHQLSLAVLKYESAMGTFPPITEASDNVTNDKFGSGLANTGWMPRILPQLEQADLYQKFSYKGQDNNDLGWTDSSNQLAYGVRVKVFECPASQTSAADRLLSGTGSGWPGSYTNAANTDYIGSSGIKKSMIDPGSVYLPPGANYPDQNSGDTISKFSLTCGAFGVGSGRKISEIVDGTSNTLMITESSDRPRIWRKGKLDTTSTPSDLTGNLNICGAWAAPNAMGFRSFLADGSNGDGPVGINASNFQGSMYSFHPNGVNAAMCDGSVRFLDETMDVRTIIALITVAGHEVIDAGDKVKDFTQQ